MEVLSFMFANTAFLLGGPDLKVSAVPNYQVKMQYVQINIKHSRYWYV